jgi:hypothetical protein
MRVPGSRVSPGTRPRGASRPPAARDRRPFRVYTRDPHTGLLVSDGLTYIGEHCAQREAAKISRILGQEAEARPRM